MRNLDPRFYTDPEMFAQECACIFWTSWQLIDPASSLANAGGKDDVEYGISPEDEACKLAEIKKAAVNFGVAELAERAGISSRHLSNL